MEKYDDIINMPHHESTKHPKLSIKLRPAQFAPFAALTGYEEEVEKTIKHVEENVLNFDKKKIQ